MAAVKHDNITLRRCSEATEKEICEFYYEILRQKFHDEPVKFLKKVKSSLKKLVLSNSPKPVKFKEDISFKDYATRCAYIVGYGVLHSSVIADHFLKFLTNHASITEKLLVMKRLRLCCLGGGPGPEAFAICKVISDLMTKRGPKERPPLEIHVTIIDECVSWQQDAFEIMNAVGSSKLCEGKLKLSFKFIQADLQKPLSEEVQKKLKKSHIVTMVKFVSDVYHSMKDDDSENFNGICEILNEVVSHLNQGCVLFFVDYCGPGLFKAVSQLMRGYPNISHVHGSSMRFTHCLHKSSEERLTNLHTEFFNNTERWPTQTIVCCVAWMIRKLSSQEGNEPIICFVNLPGPLPTVQQAATSLTKKDQQATRSLKGKDNKRDQQEGISVKNQNLKASRSVKKSDQQECSSVKSQNLKARNSVKKRDQQSVGSLKDQDKKSACSLTKQGQQLPNTLRERDEQLTKPLTETKKAIKPKQKKRKKHTASSVQSQNQQATNHAKEEINKPPAL